jgi:hypothetical protein
VSMSGQEPVRRAPGKPIRCGSALAGRRLGPPKVLALAVTLGVWTVMLSVVAVSARADVTIGSTLSDGPPTPSLCSGGCTVLQTIAAGETLSVPSDGVITSWSVRSADSGAQYELRVIRPAGGGEYTAAGTSQPESVPDAADEVRGPFPVSLAVKAGDEIGLKVLSGAGAPLGVNPDAPASDTVNYFGAPNPDFGDGSTQQPVIQPPPTNGGQELLLQATFTPGPAPPPPTTTTTTTTTSTTPGPVPPVAMASFAIPSSPPAFGHLLPLDASASRPRGATVKSFTWTVDGHRVAVCDGSTSALATRSIPAGTSLVGLQVTDASGVTTSVSHDVTVSGPGDVLTGGSRAVTGRRSRFAGGLHVVRTNSVFTCDRATGDPVVSVVAGARHTPANGCQTQVETGIVQATGCLTEFDDPIHIQTTMITSKVNHQTYTLASLPIPQTLPGVPGSESFTLLDDIEDFYVKNPTVQICQNGPSDLKYEFCQPPPGDGEGAPNPSLYGPRGSPPAANAVSPTPADRGVGVAHRALSASPVASSRLLRNVVLDTPCSQTPSGPALDMACLDLYVSTGPVAINGLEYVPQPGSVVVVAPQFNLVISNAAEIDLSQLRLKPAAPINYQLPSSGQGAEQDFPALDVTNLRALLTPGSRAAQQLGSVGGFSVAPDSGLQISFSADYSATFTFEVALPSPFSDGNGHGVTATVHGQISNSQGLQIVYADLGSSDGGGVSVDLGPVQLHDFGVCFRHQDSDDRDVDPCPQITGIPEPASPGGFGSDFWDASGELDIGGSVSVVFRPQADPVIPGCSTDIPLGFGFGGGQLRFAGAALAIPAVPIAPGVTFNGLAAGLRQGATPQTEIAGGCAEFQVLGLVDVTGNMFAAFGPYQFNGAELGAGVLQQSGNPPRYPGSLGLAIGASGVVSLQLPEIGALRIGDAYLLYINDPASVFFGAAFDWSVPLGSTYDDPPDTGIAITGGLDGGIGLSGGGAPPFYFEGFERAVGRLGIGGPAELTVFRGSVAAIVSDQPSTGAGGIALCGSVTVYGLDATAGFGYHWGDDIGQVLGDIHIGGSCQDEWFTSFNVDVQAGTATTHATHATPMRIHVSHGEQAVDVYLHGRGGAPDVTVTGPDGTHASTAASIPGHATETDSVLLARVPISDQTDVALLHPIAGAYTITPNPDSPPITRLTQTQAIKPAISARVTGHGLHRRLVYDVKREPGQLVTFIEHSAQDTRALGSTHAGHGSMWFTAAPGRGQRSIIAEIMQGGAPATSLAVASYPALRPRLLGRVQRVRVHRSGTTARITFARVAAASTYDIYVALSNGERRSYATTERRLIITRLLPEAHGLIVITAAGDPGYTLTSHPATIRLAAAIHFHRPAHAHR